MLVNFVSVSRVRESRTHGLIRGGCRKAVAYFLDTGNLNSPLQPVFLRTAHFCPKNTLQD